MPGTAKDPSPEELTRAWEEYQTWIDLADQHEVNDNLNNRYRELEVVRVRSVAPGPVTVRKTDGTVETRPMNEQEMEAYGRVAEPE